MTLPTQKLIGISDLEKQYVGMAIDRGLFLKTFEPNGSEANGYRYYLAETEDTEYLFAAYQEEDPRLIDYPPEDQDEGEEDRYLGLPYPDLSLGAAIHTDENGNTFITSVGICKEYATGCMTGGVNSDVLIQAEADRINTILSSVAVKGVRSTT